MEAIFLGERDLAVKDHAPVGAGFEIILDALTPQKSTIPIPRGSVSAEVGDYVAVRDGAEFRFLGVVAEIGAEDGSGSLKVSAKDFLSKLDAEVPVSSYKGDASEFLLQLVRTNFMGSGDPLQNLPYLSTEAECYAACDLTYADDATANIVDLSEEFAKTYGVRLAHELAVSNGKIAGIRVKAVSSRRGIVIRSDLGTISNLSISDSGESGANKITYVPKAENALHKEKVSYYLLSDGKVTADASSEKRITPVAFKTGTYGDKDYDGLATKAASALASGSLEHCISFDLALSANKLESLEGISIGDAVELIAPGRTYYTMVTKIAYKGTFKAASVTLGEGRATLTDKLRLLSRKGR